jgi:integrase
LEKRRKTAAFSNARKRKRTWQTKTGEHAAWVADYFSPGPDGKRQRHTRTSFTTRREATAWLATTTVEIKQGVHTPAHRSPTVIEAGEQWIAQAEADGLERASVRQYAQHLRLHIRPFIGLHKLTDLTPATVADFRNVLIGQGRSRVLAGMVVSSLGSILSEAMTRGKVARNVVREQARGDRRRARVEKRHKRQLQVGVDLPTKDELRAMLEHAGPLRPLLVTAIFTGLRASELRGLTWSDVDLDHRVLTVRQRADRWGTIGSPKSDAGKREVPLAPRSSARCVNGDWHVPDPPRARSRRACGWSSRTATGTSIRTITSTGPPGSAGCSTTPASRPTRGPRNMVSTVCGTAQRPCSSRRASRSKPCRRCWGHSTVAMTLDVYTHLFPSAADDQAAMSQLQARLIG